MAIPSAKQVNFILHVSLSKLVFYGSMDPTYNEHLLKLAYWVQVINI